MIWKVASIAVTATRLGPGMSIEQSGLVDDILAPADDEDVDGEVCPACQSPYWFRLIASYMRGACWVIYCAGCGKPIEARWNIIP